MKKFLPLFILIISRNCISQSVPNGGFENWNSTTFEQPQYFVETSNPEAFLKCNVPFNCVKTTDAYHGSLAVKLTTGGDSSNPCVGYVINVPAPNGPPQHGGIPYSQKPTGLKGFYKSAIPAGDSALILVNFSLAGNPIGFYSAKFYGTNSSYTGFNIDFTPPLAVNPDSMWFGAVSSDFMSGVAIPGSMFQLDSVSFTGVTSQPAEFNGDFENWQNTSITLPSGWYTSGPLSVKQSTDAKSGNYALEVSTILSDKNGNQTAQAGYVSTGNYECNQGGPCVLQGGQPFSQQIDTLVFYYKYTPAQTGDKATVNITFKNNGNISSGIMQYLPVASSYQSVLMPFNLTIAPDTVIVQFQSSIVSDTIVSFVGAKLTVDDIKFKSQPVFIYESSPEESFILYPNPASDFLIVSSPSEKRDVTRVNIYNALGEKVATDKTDENHSSLPKQVVISHLPKGMYFCEVIYLQNSKRIKFVKE